MITLEHLRDTVHDRMLAERSVDRIVSSHDFRHAWDRATKHQKNGLEYLCFQHDPNELRDFITSILCNDLESKPYAEIREIAMKERIPKYSRMHRDEMIRAIQQVRVQRINKELGL